MEELPVHDLAILAVAAVLNLSSPANSLAGPRPPCAAATTTQATNPPAPTTSRPTVCMVDPDMISQH
jgi:hypothetical protein